MPSHNQSLKVILLSLLAAGLDILASVILRYSDLGSAARIAVALMPLPGSSRNDMWTGLSVLSFTNGRLKFLIVFSPSLFD